jgi:hypothetical protein
MHYIQSRLFAPTLQEALELIFAKHGFDCKPAIRMCNVQPRRGVIWWEYNIVKEGEK